LISREQLELLGKYTSDLVLPFDQEELRTVFSLLNINSGVSKYEETRLLEYRDAVRSATSTQNRVMTVFCAELLKIRQSKTEADALQYAVDNLDKVISPFMLDVLAGVLSAGERRGQRQ
jgi:hypothetical protein